MSLYPDSGRVISASGGVITTTRPQLEEGIKAFWTYVGQNMRNPKWEWTSMNVDVLAPDAAVMTSTYRVPHLTPTGMNHVIGGGGGGGVFEKKGAGGFKPGGTSGARGPPKITMWPNEL